MTDKVYSIEIMDISAWQLARQLSENPHSFTPSKLYDCKVNTPKGIKECYVKVTRGRGRNAGKWYGTFAYKTPVHLIAHDTREVISTREHWVRFRGLANEPIKTYKEI